MALKEYHKRRVLGNTPEPTSGKPATRQLQFVVQEHDASRLHYDFRLEMEGVLKSWAIPRGPSLNPEDKRLAMMVEDHPFDYKDFEGIIPEGNYGAGQVIVWDQGTYEPLVKKTTKKEQEKELLKELKSGSLKFRLSGKKLKGEFALVHIKNNRQKGDNAWLLIKHKDEFASPADITKKGKSVRSGKTVLQIGKDKPAEQFFAGLREDKKAEDEKNEAVIKDPPKTKTGNKTAVGKKRAFQKRVKAESAKAASMVKAREKKGSKNTAPGAETILPDEKNQEITLNKHTLTLTNLDKVYWPKEKITKGDMIRYYDEATEFIIPYLKDRPQSLNRYPNGIDGESFYQKNVSHQAPDWMKTYRYKSESDGKYKQFLVATDRASLLYMANLGCIEMNPWNSRIQKPDNPDWCVIDIDPDKTNTFNQVIEVAIKIKTYLDQLKVTAYCKTSGSTGMHIYIPLAAKYTYDQSRMFAEMLVTAVQQELPAISSVERSLSKRKGKIYLDFLQNRQIQTIAAPYSLRPKPGATVSMPLHWEEVKPGLKISDFNIHNALGRMRQEPDIFRGVLGPGINLNKILSAMEKKQKLDEGS